ncbi:uncharacterized protein C1orf198 homolog isoform X3 [Chiloscyllium punctatum]|uniref:uncharacterized protein C1orf198 homolog isoform X3 n=1 Tax=Chiloscyllium punctatum TaxID=137246 RepID=UPI003B6363EF
MLPGLLCFFSSTPFNSFLCIVSVGNTQLAFLSYTTVGFKSCSRLNIKIEADAPVPRVCQGVGHAVFQSQMEFNFASIAASEQGVSVQSEQRQPVKTSQGNHQLKTPQGGLPTKPLQNGKTPSIDGLAQVRKEESSSFWKLSNERSRLEGEQSDYQYVTPSQIKSMEKGEKPLASYLRQESLSKDKDENKAEKPRVKKQERIINTNVSSVFIDLDRPRTNQPSVSVCDDISTHGHTEKSPDKKTVSKESVDEERDDSCASDAPLFSQINTSSSILKTGFDFLDNW